jgi:hypothetical protein
VISFSIVPFRKFPGADRARIGCPKSIDTLEAARNLRVAGGVVVRKDMLARTLGIDARYRAAARRIV